MLKEVLSWQKFWHSGTKTMPVQYLCWTFEFQWRKGWSCTKKRTTNPRGRKRFDMFWMQQVLPWQWKHDDPPDVNLQIAKINNFLSEDEKIRFQTLLSKILSHARLFEKNFGRSGNCCLLNEKSHYCNFLELCEIVFIFILILFLENCCIFPETPLQYSP